MTPDTKLLSIGKVARRTGLTVRALRHYDEIDLLPPHDVDPDTGYRRYTNEQVERAATIRALRELDVPVETIRSFLDATDATAAAQVVSAHLTNVDARAWRLHGIQHRLRMMIEEGATMATDGRTDAGTNDDDVERALAMDLFNETWTLLETEDRTHDHDERMVHAAHASRYHWEQVGGPEQLAVGDWQVSRVYSVLGRPEPALHHAREALARAEGADVPTWVLASAHEAMARASGVAGDGDAAREHADRARALAATIDDAEDRQVVMDDLATLSL
jgi:DNA-binding transcriptional MerR regulator